jgi:hypothetical protein
MKTKEEYIAEIKATKFSKKTCKAFAKEGLMLLDYSDNYVWIDIVLNDIVEEKDFIDILNEAKK